MSSIIYVLLNSFSGTELMLFAIALVALAIGSYTDFRKREVPDWMSYSFVFIALGIRLIYSAITFDWMFFVYGILGFFVFLGIALLMFYTGQWGGGDAKVLAGIGAAIGLKFSLDSMLIAFVINTIIIGGLYGLVYSFYLASRNRSKFFRKFWSLLSDKKIKSKQKTALIVTVLLLLISLFSGFFFGFKSVVFYFVSPLSVMVLFYLWVFVKAVEDSSFYRFVEPDKLTEGDWIVREIHADGRYVCGPKDLGIEKPQIKKLIELKKRNKVKKILIKEGIPFVPSFLLTFIATLIFGNLMLWMIGRIYG